MQPENDQRPYATLCEEHVLSVDFTLNPVCCSWSLESLLGIQEEDQEAIDDV